MKIENIKAASELYERRTKLMNGLSLMDRFRYADFRMYFTGEQAQSQQDVKNSWGVSEAAYEGINSAVAQVFRSVITAELENISKKLLALGVEL